MIELTYGISEIVNKEIEDGIMAEARVTVGWNIDKQALIEAVEKGTPKDIVLTVDDLEDTIFICPKCEKEIRHIKGAFYPNYCYHCGQKLFWDIARIKRGGKDE